MASVILSTQPASTLSVVPNQNTTFTVAASANFDVTSYSYQWKRSATAGGLIGAALDITGATSSSYKFEPASADNGFKYYCVVTATGVEDEEPATATVNTTGIALTVATDGSIFSAHVKGAVAAVNPSKESGQERFRRIRHLGYC